jgi:tryptophanyl-tRNA synthetase
MKKQRVLSGVQATGGQHLGNYLGALKRWAEIQETHECYYFIADLHAMTVDRSPEELTRSTIESAAILFASGLDPKKTTIFIQSQISAHSEFAWILNCITPMGWLNRMTQFKDKAGKDKESASAGLFTYPVLQSADILLYQPDLIPVGEDQKQHIELTRDIAGAVNRKCGYDFLKIPEPMIPKDVARVKSLRDGTKKMSKSDPSDQSRINLSDDDDTIISKFKKAKTDSIAEITYEPEKRPEIANYFQYTQNYQEET